MGKCHLVAVFALAAGLLRAAGPCAGPSPDVDSWLGYWQEKQHLENWKINVLVVRQAEIPGLYGNITWDRNTHRAIIHVLAETDGRYSSYDCRTAFGASEIVHNMENTVIHELVHLALAPLRQSGTHREEVAVSDISGALQEMVIPGHVYHPQHEASLFEIRWFIEAKLAPLCRSNSVEPQFKEEVVQRLAKAFRELHPKTFGVP